MLFVVAFWVQLGAPVVGAIVSGMILFLGQRHVRNHDASHGKIEEAVAEIGTSIADIKADTRMLAERHELAVKQNERDHLFVRESVSRLSDEVAEISTEQAVQGNTLRLMKERWMSE